MKNLIIGAAIASTALFAGCAMLGGPTTATATGVGGIVMDHKAPGQQQIDNSVQCAKCGKAKSTCVVLFTSGDSSIKAAMDDGKITKVHHIDYESKNIFNFYSEATTIVWGE